MLQAGRLLLYATFTYPFACVPFLYFYYASHGVGLTDYGVLVAIYYIAMVVAEVPTGLLADRYGKRPAMALGPALLAAGFAVVWLFPGHGAFCAGQAILGLGHSVLSGPPSALLFQKLRAAGREREFLRHESRMQAARLLGTGGSFLLGGFVVAELGLAASIPLTAALCLVAAVTALTVDEPAPTGTASRRVLLRAALDDLRRPAVRWVLAYFVVLFCLLRFPFHCYQPYLAAIGEQDPRWIGALFFLLNLLAAPCSRLVPRLSARFGDRALFCAMPLALAASLLAMGGRQDWLGVGLFFAQQVPFGMHWALVQGFVNHRVEDTARATVLSALSFSGRLAFAVTFPLAIAAAGEDLSTCFLLAGVAGALGSLGLLVRGAHHLPRRAER